MESKFEMTRTNKSTKIQITHFIFYYLDTLNILKPSAKRAKTSKFNITIFHHHNLDALFRITKG